jgi:HK97 family phage prohead protease
LEEVDGAGGRELQAESRDSVNEFIRVPAHSRTSFAGRANTDVGCKVPLRGARLASLKFSESRSKLTREQWKYLRIPVAMPDGMRCREFDWTRNTNNREQEFQMNRELFHAVGVELRTAEQGNARTLSGYAATFNTRSCKIGGKFIEMLAPGAFTKVLAKTPDVRMLVNHDPTHILGRTMSGTLELSQDDRGLQFRCMLPDTQVARDAYESIKRGDMSQCSFGFGLEKGDDSWGDGLDDRGVACPIRTIRNVSELADVSCVTYPAYEETSVVARKLFEGIYIPKPPTTDNERFARVKHAFREING